LQSPLHELLLRGGERAPIEGKRFLERRIAMLLVVVVGILVGAVLGLRFTIFALVPVTCGALAIAVVDEMAYGHGLSGLIVTVIMIVISTQLGYMLGVFVRTLLMGAGQVGNRNEVSLPTSAGMSKSV
jgi:hypothetical protein